VYDTISGSRWIVGSLCGAYSAGDRECLVRMRELLVTPTTETDAQEAITLLGTFSDMANTSLKLDQDGAPVTIAEVFSASSPISFASLHALHAATLPIATGNWNIRVHGVFGCFGVSQPPVYFCWGLMFLCSASQLPSPSSLLSQRSLLLPRLILKLWLQSDRSPLG
jgi:hypothetical protein